MKVGVNPALSFWAHIQDGQQFKPVSCLSHMSVQHQTEAVRSLRRWADSRLVPLYLIKAIPSGKQMSVSQCETRPRREGDHTATLSRSGRGQGNGGVVVSLIPDPPMSLWFPCQSALMEVTAVLLLYILISCSSRVTQPSAICLA